MRISVKNLSALAMPDSCLRCFWIKQKLKLPYQIFPGIFSSIDAYTKKVVHTCFDATEKAPSWLPEIADAVRYLKAPHWSKYLLKDVKTGITISGVVDDLFECKDGSRIIVDYKTAKYTANADKLFPLYEAQLNGYAMIEEGYGHAVRDEMYLIYCEPMTTEKDAMTRFEDAGFNMGFSVKSVPVKKNQKLILGLLDEANAILSGPMPNRTEGCNDCDRVFNLVEAVTFTEPF